MGRPRSTAVVSLVRGLPREEGIPRAIGLLGINPVKGKPVLLKPNFNTADPFPGSTHNDTLRNLIGQLRDMGAADITVADRSGPAETAEVIMEKGVDRLCEELGVKVMDFDGLGGGQWVKVRPEAGHWKDGFEIAKPVLDAPAVVTTCCLKTHGYGAVFTMSLKISVGMVRRKYMSDLHGPRREMGKMIAEINTAYSPSLILMDALEAFVDSGPMTGPRKKAGVILAGTDRIAVDAVGLAVLKDLGSNRAIMEAPIFEQQQISRAVELGLGVDRPEKIRILTDDPAAAEYAERLMEILRKE